MGAKKSKKSSRQQSKLSAGKSQDIKELGENDDWFVISDIDQLKSVAHPLRIKLLAEFAELPRTTKQVADELGEPPTKLYHHVDALVTHGLLVLKKELPKRGTTEKYYQSAAKQFRVDEGCFGQPEVSGARERAILNLLDSTKSNIIQQLATQGSPSGQCEGQAAAMSGYIKVDSGDIENFLKSINEAIESWSSKPKKTKSQAGSHYRFAIFIFPDGNSSKD